MDIRFNDATIDKETMTKPGIKHTCVVGLGWGDEGKGKIVDLLCPAFDVVVRYNGGANAGHTVVVGDESFALHLLPAGVLHPSKTAVIGPGVAIDPTGLLSEIDGLEQRGLSVAERVKVSDRAHLVMDYHKVEDRLAESQGGGANKIGTTARGIGPCYADKMRRTTAIRAVELHDSAALKGKVRRIAEQRKRMFAAVYGDDRGLDMDACVAQITDAAKRIAPMVTDTTALLDEQIEADRRILFEGANGMLLDVDHGTYPFVTSSQTGPQGVAGGAGVSPDLVTCRIGVTKAYATRVGQGPFPSELTDAMGERIREKGHEYGTTTGRPRRCGWLDLVSLRYSVRLGGITDIALAHLDTLGGFDEIAVCIGYEHKGRRIDRFAADAGVLSDVTPVFEAMPGWPELGDVETFNALPDNAKRYVQRIETFVGAPVTIVSVGAARSRTIFRHDALEDAILSANAS